MQVTIDLPDKIALSETEIRTELAIGFAKLRRIALFQQERITLSRASKIARIDLMEFQKLISDRGICIHYDVKEFEQDVQHLRDRGWL